VDDNDLRMLSQCNCMHSSAAGGSGAQSTHQACSGNALKPCRAPLVYSRPGASSQPGLHALHRGACQHTPPLACDTAALTLFLPRSSWHALCGPGPDSPLAHVHAGADHLVHQQQLRRHDWRAVQDLRAAGRVAVGRAPRHTARGGAIQTRANSLCMSQHQSLNIHTDRAARSGQPLMQSVSATGPAAGADHGCSRLTRLAGHTGSRCMRAQPRSAHAARRAHGLGAAPPPCPSQPMPSAHMCVWRRVLLGWG